MSTPVRCLCTACRPCIHCFAPLGSHPCPCSSTTSYLTQAQPSSTPCCMLLRLCLLPPYSQSLSPQACLLTVSKHPCPAALSCECGPHNCRLRSELQLTITPAPACLQLLCTSCALTGCRHPSTLPQSIPHSPVRHRVQIHNTPFNCSQIHQLYLDGDGLLSQLSVLQLVAETFSVQLQAELQHAPG